MWEGRKKGKEGYVYEKWKWKLLMPRILSISHGQIMNPNTKKKKVLANLFIVMENFLNSSVTPH